MIFRVGVDIEVILMNFSRENPYIDSNGWEMTDIVVFRHELLNFLQGVLSVHTYRPQWSWGKVIFSEACVKNSVHRGGSPPLHAGKNNPPGTRGRHPPGTRGRHPPGPEADPRNQRQVPPQCSAWWEIRATSGWYASYWNAILWFHFSSKGTIYLIRWVKVVALFSHIVLH